MAIVEDEVIKAEIQDGLSQVDSNLVISELRTIELEKIADHIVSFCMSKAF